MRAEGERQRAVRSGGRGRCKSTEYSASATLPGRRVSTLSGAVCKSEEVQRVKSIHIPLEREDVRLYKDKTRNRVREYGFSEIADSEISWGVGYIFDALKGLEATTYVVRAGARVTTIPNYRERSGGL